MWLYHHLHIRKRISRGLEPYPAHKFWMRVLDRVVVLCGIIGTIMTVPQLANIYVDHNAAGVSALSWGAYAVLDIPWIIYALAHREPPLIITYALWLVLNTLVCVGALIYG